MEYLSERVSVSRADGRTSVVISARLPKSKEALLITWAVAWSLCGAYVLYARSAVPEGDPLRQYMLAFLAFWAYFAFKVGKALLWRLKGFELWRIKDGTLTIKDSLFGFGKARPYFVDNITHLGLLNIDERSWKWQLNDSFWVIGGERLGFEHMGRKVAFGKGLSPEEARKLVPVLKAALAQERKKG
ncbi:MAG: hypothetical protein R2815_09235 [Flavobacteriales bacterium]|nr:hypothetical protein [Flavobacteriales bacterium]